MTLATTTPPAPIDMPGTAPQGFTPATPGAALVEVSTLNSSHSYYELFNSTWEDVDVLYQGGRIIQMQASRFLFKKGKEMPDVYASRLQRFTYHNLLGTALGYYLAKLFEENPEIDIKSNGVAIADPDEKPPVVEGGTKPPAPKPGDKDLWEFYVESFLADCDGAKQSYIDFWREAIRQALLFKRCFILLDLPKGTQNAQTRGEQNLRPFLRIYDPRQALNWEADAAGNLKWIVFRVESTERSFLKEPVRFKRWYFFDDKQFLTYEWRSDNPSRGQTHGKDMAALIDSGPHSMADYEDEETGVIGRVPVEVFDLPDGMWLAHRVYLPLLDHLNTDNSLGWALFQANLAVPVITGPSEYQPTVTEVGYIYIREGTFAWAEPSGTSFDHSQKRIDNLREEIFRLMYLQAQGRSSAATPASQSGYSKELDMAPAGDVLKFLGDKIREKMQCILYLVAGIRQEEDDVDFDIRGFDFDDDEVLPEIEATAGAQALQIRSETFKREIEKQLIRRYGKDWNPELLTTCCGEVDAAPTQEELDDQQAEKENDQIKSSMNNAALKLTIQHGPGSDGKAMFPKPADKKAPGAKPPAANNKKG